MTRTFKRYLFYNKTPDKQAVVQRHYGKLTFSISDSTSLTVMLFNKAAVLPATFPGCFQEYRNWDSNMTVQSIKKIMDKKYMSWTNLSTKGYSIKKWDKDIYHFVWGKRIFANLCKGIYIFSIL